MFELVYSGFDKLDIAFLGALPETTLATLRMAKDQAQKENEAQLVTIGPGKVEAHVYERGLKGGYAFRLDTGPVGANFFFKDNANTNDWNIFVASKSFGFLAHGFEDYRDQISQTLIDLGAIVRKESLNRVDFAMDFKTTGFELNPYQFVAPPKAKLKINSGEWEGRPDDWKPSIIMSGRKVETVTIGKMPNRQVCVYDKRAEAVQKRKPQWFEVWGINPKDKSQQVWRVELRVGKHYLSQIYGLKTFRDLDDSIGDVFGKLAKDVRYLETKQSDTNVTRAAVHPLWMATNQALNEKLTDHRSGLLPGRIEELELEKKLDIHTDLVLGNAIVIGAINDIPLLGGNRDLPEAIHEILKKEIETNAPRLAKKVCRIRERLRLNKLDTTQAWTRQ